MNEDGLTSSIRDKILTITVKKGWKQGTRITFPQEGDQGPNNIPGTCISFPPRALYCCQLLLCFDAVVLATERTSDL